MGNAWTFGRKLALGFAAVVTLAVCMALVAFFALRIVTSQYDELMTKNVQNVSDAQSIVILRYRKAAALRGYLINMEDRFSIQIQDANSEFEATMNTLKGRVVSEDDRQHLAEIDRAWDTHDTAAQKVVAQAKGGDLKGAQTEYDGKVQDLGSAVSNKVTAYQTQQKTVLEQARQAAASVVGSAITIVIVICLASLVIAGVLGFYLTRNLTRQIGASVQHVRSSSAELQAAATQQASGAKEQATAMKEITTTIGELLVTSRQIDESAQQVSKISEDTAGSARAGNEHVAKSQEVLASIRRQVDTIVNHMLDLGRKSQQIGGILEIINELSEQTNILAINATIEAAGAGEGGRRFAVVGDEIRKLADRVGGSAKEIRNLIEEIRAAVNTTVMATETGSKTVEAGSQRFSELAESFAKIGRLVETTNGAAREIKLGTKQQTSAVEQVNVAIANVSQSTRETEASSAQTLQTASQLKTLSDDLVRLISSNHSN